jgi:hypothetical protein
VHENESILHETQLADIALRSNNLRELQGLQGQPPENSNEIWLEHAELNRIKI